MYSYSLLTNHRTLVVCCLLLLHVARTSSAELLSSATPFATGAHLQLVRRFYTAADGLPSENIMAAATTRDGAVLVGTDAGVARLEGETWVRQAGINAASALFGPTAGPSALAGGTNAVWALENNQWRLESGSAANVIALAAERDGQPWAL